MMFFLFSNCKSNLLFILQNFNRCIKTPTKLYRVKIIWCRYNYVLVKINKTTLNCDGVIILAIYVYDHSLINYCSLFLKYLYEYSVIYKMQLH